jgi:hypothetical protein
MAESVIRDLQNAAPDFASRKGRLMALRFLISKRETKDGRPRRAAKHPGGEALAV